MFRVVLCCESDVGNPFTASHVWLRSIRRGFEIAGIQTFVITPNSANRLGFFSRSFLILKTLRACVKPPLILYYGQKSTSLIMLWFASRLCRVHFVPYVVEWPKAIPKSSIPSKLNARLYSTLVFRLASSAIVISHFLETEAHRIRPHLPVLRVPTLCDPEPWTVQPQPCCSPPTALYCANLDNYQRDALFVIETMALVSSTCKLIMVGPAREETRRTLIEFAHEHSLVGALEFRSNLEEDELRSLLVSASALFLPMFDDDRSRARFPIKLGEYLMSGTPIVTSPIGEIGVELTKNSNVRFHTPNDSRGAARLVDEILKCPTTAELGNLPDFLDYRLTTRKIIEFIAESMSQ